MPLDIQLEAACAAASVNHASKVEGLLQPYGYPDSPFFSQRALKRFLSFSPLELLDYLHRHPEQCEELFFDCQDKRSTPSTFVQQTPRHTYRVGMFEPERGETSVQEFGTLKQAITDYVLYSLKLGRLQDV